MQLKTIKNIILFVQIVLLVIQIITGIGYLCIPIVLLTLLPMYLE